MGWLQCCANRNRVCIRHVLCCWPRPTKSSRQTNWREPWGPAGPPSPGSSPCAGPAPHRAPSWTPLRSANTASRLSPTARCPTHSCLQQNLPAAAASRVRGTRCRSSWSNRNSGSRLTAFPGAALLLTRPRSRRRAICPKAGFPVCRDSCAFSVQHVAAHGQRVACSLLHSSACTVSGRSGFTEALAAGLHWF